MSLDLELGLALVVIVTGELEVVVHAMILHDAVHGKAIDSDGFAAEFCFLVELSTFRILLFV